MDSFHFKHIGQQENSLSTVPQKRSAASHGGRHARLSLLDRMSQSEDAPIGASAVAHADTAVRTIPRSPKILRHQKQRGHAEPSLADRISAPDTPPLLNRISAPESLLRRTEQRTSPSNKQGASGGSASASQSTGDKSPPLSVLQNVQNVSPNLAVLRNTSSTNLTLDRHSPPSTTMDSVNTGAQDATTTDLARNPVKTSGLLQIRSSPSPIPTTCVHQSGTPPPNYANDFSMQPLSPSMLPLSQQEVPAERKSPSSSALIPPSTSRKTLLAPPTSLRPVSMIAFATPLVAVSSTSTVTNSSPQLLNGPATPPRQLDMPIRSPPNSTPDMLAFYLKPLWAESAAQMREWAEVANERAHVKQANNRETSKSKDARGVAKVGEVRQRNENETEMENVMEEKRMYDKKAGDLEKEEAEGHAEVKEDTEKVQQTRTGRHMGTKRLRPDDEEGAEVEADVGVKRIKISTLVSSTPAVSGQDVHAQAKADLVVAQEELWIVDRTRMDRSLPTIDAAQPVLICNQTAGKAKQRTTDVMAATGGNSVPQMQQDLPLKDIAPCDRSSVEPIPKLGATSDTHPQRALPESHEQFTNIAASAPTAEELDETRAMRKRHLQQELAIHQREERERIRQLEAERARQEEAGRILKEREDELREAMKKRKMEKARLQVVPAVPTEPTLVSVTPPAALPVTPVSNPLTTHTSPKHVTQRLPPKPRPLSGGVALGPSSAVSASEVMVPTVPMDPPQATVQNGLQSVKPAKTKGKKTSDSSTITANMEAPSSKPDLDTVVMRLSSLPSTAPANVACQEPIVAVKKEEPQTPLIPCTTVNMVTPALQLSTQGPPSSSHLGTEMPDVHSATKLEPIPEPEPIPSTLVNARKHRLRSASLAALGPPVIKKRRESSPPAPNLQLMYPDAASETSGWGQIDVDDEEERRPGRRRRVRTRTPEDVDNRECLESNKIARPPSQPGGSRSKSKSQSRSRSRSRSPLYPVHAREPGAFRVPRGRSRGWRAGEHTSRRHERYHSPPRSPSPQRTGRPRTPVGPRPVYDHYNPSPPPRVHQRPGLDAETTSTSSRPGDYYQNHRERDGYIPAPPLICLSPPRESFWARCYPSTNSYVPQSQAEAPLRPPIPGSPPRGSHPHLLPRIAAQSELQPHNADLPRYTRPTSPLPRSRSPLHELYPWQGHHSLSIGPPMSRSQNANPPHPPLISRSPPHESHSHAIRPLPPAGPPIVRSQHNPPPSLTEEAPPDREGHATEPRSDRRVPGGYDYALLSAPQVPVMSGVQGYHPPIPRQSSSEADDRRTAHRHRPYSVSHRSASAGNEAIASVPFVTYDSSPQPQRSLRDRVSPQEVDNVERPPYASNTHRGYKEFDTKLRQAQRARETDGLVNANRKKLAARLSDRAK